MKPQNQFYREQPWGGTGFQPVESAVSQDSVRKTHIEQADAKRLTHVSNLFVELIWKKYSRAITNFSGTTVPTV